MYDLNSLAEAIQSFNGVTLLEVNQEEFCIIFESSSNKSLETILVQINEIKNEHNFSFFSFEREKTSNYYQIIIEDKNLESIDILTKRLKLASELNGDENKIQSKEFGIPDLSLVTIKQMANALKQRSNLTFAIVWTEDSNKDNIAIEGSGNPTQLIGLLARGSHMAIEWVDKSIKYNNPDQ